MRDPIGDLERSQLLTSLQQRDYPRVHKQYPSDFGFYAVEVASGGQSHILMYRARDLRNLCTHAGTIMFLENTFSRFAFENTLRTQLRPSRFDEPASFEYSKVLGRWSGFIKGSKIYLPVLGNVENCVPRSIRFKGVELHSWFDFWVRSCTADTRRHTNPIGDYNLATMPLAPDSPYNREAKLMTTLYASNGAIPFLYETKLDESSGRFKHNKECPIHRPDTSPLI